MTKIKSKTAQRLDEQALRRVTGGSMRKKATFKKATRKKATRAIWMYTPS